MDVRIAGSNGDVAGALRHDLFGCGQSDGIETLDRLVALGQSDLVGIDLQVARAIGDGGRSAGIVVQQRDVRRIDEAGLACIVEDAIQAAAVQHQIVEDVLLAGVDSAQGGSAVEVDVVIAVQREVLEGQCFAQQCPAQGQ